MSSSVVEVSHRLRNRLELGRTTHLTFLSPIKKCEISLVASSIEIQFSACVLPSRWLVRALLGNVMRVWIMHWAKWREAGFGFWSIQLVDILLSYDYDPPVTVLMKATTFQPSPVTFMKQTSVVRTSEEKRSQVPFRINQQTDIIRCPISLILAVSALSHQIYNIQSTSRTLLNPFILLSTKN